ncbi:MAG: hypothetical protein D3917_05405 [Candidatus Electrothrix sp. AX5]|jgi:hypothetical protein|uniref:Uncharacterized protein n=1 Tax=Candidatus Electrothrix aarhusensis TaxID=1859131 RepID=A0A444IYV9_9BACT|nr:hypothetical protein [Candidatus Electrothrix sp. AX5]RWX46064.1 hypothetical protein H206_02262 [Candidatus Electrothrix aarhusensis]
MMKEKQNSNELHAALDPGYLMLAVYVLGVSFLVLFAWLGGNSTALEGDHQGKARVVAHELMTETPVVADHFMADKGLWATHESKN